ncbi:hypothetical protein AB1Y20_008592 [Prymnesium parvum]|uniref:RING-type domain-containing protein n=1 Tax=Prymnesium parvum TaxID=97485 RepID=A0AB34ITI6_PRYPA
MPRTRRMVRENRVNAIVYEQLACLFFRRRVDARTRRAYARMTRCKRGDDWTCAICMHSTLGPAEDRLGFPIITSCGHALHAVCAFQYVQHAFDSRRVGSLPPHLLDQLSRPLSSCHFTMIAVVASKGLLFASCPTCRGEHAFAHFFG